MSLELRRRMMVKEANEMFDPVYRLMIGDGYTREQMTGICGVDIVSLFNKAKNTIVYNGVKYMKVTSCALPLNSTTINVPDANNGQYWSSDAIYVFYENGTLKEKVFSGGSCTFTDTTSSKAIVYYARYHKKEQHVNFNLGLYSSYNFFANNKKINVLWTFEPYDNYATQHSHFNNSTLKQIHYSYERPNPPELRNCSSIYGTLLLTKTDGNKGTTLSALNSITGIIIGKDCGEITNISMGSASSIINRDIQIDLGTSANFDFSQLYLHRSKLTVNLLDNALDTYSMSNGVLMMGNVIKTATSAIEEGTELTFGSEITAIENNAFWRSKVKKLDLSQTQIKNLPAGCINIGATLEELYLPQALEVIGSGSNSLNSYSVYTLIEKITLPETVTSLKTGSLASNNKTLHILDLPCNVNISGYAFYYFRMKELYLRWDTDEKIQAINHTVSWGVFSGAYFVDCILHIPKGMRELYEAKKYTTSIFKEIIDDL